MPVAVFIALSKKMLLLWALCSLYVYGRSRSRVVARLGPAALVIMAAWLIVFGVFARPMDHDEVEHMHCAWLVSQGQIPFKDFWQHHSPMMYIMMAPLFHLQFDPIYTPLLARTVGLVLVAGVAVIGWFISRSIWGADAKLGTYALLWLMILPLIELFTPRPDLFSTVLVIAGLGLFMVRSRRVFLVYLAGGFLQGLGLSFSPKLYLVPIATVIAAFVYHRLRAMPRLSAFALGGMLGLVPLIVYLAANGLLGDFRQWVIQFNWKKQVAAGFQFNPVLLVVGAYGTWLLMKRSEKLSGEQRLLFVAAYVCTGVAALQNPLLFIFYYATPWMILTAVAAASIDIHQWLDWGNESALKRASTGLALALLLYPTLTTVFSNTSPDTVEVKWNTWAKLCRLSENQMCLGLAPFHPIAANDAIGLYGGWQAVFAYLDPNVRDLLANRGVLASIERSRPATIQACTDDRGQPMSDYLLDIKAISRDDYKELNRYLEENYTVLKFGRPFYVRNDLLGLARAEGVPIPHEAVAAVSEEDPGQTVAMQKSK